MAKNWTLFKPEKSNRSSHSVPFLYVLVLFSHVCLGFPKGLLHSGANQHFLPNTDLTSKELAYGTNGRCVYLSLPNIINLMMFSTADTNHFSAWSKYCGNLYK
jgi:hypothetical protein